MAHFQTIKSMKWDVQNEPIDLEDYKLYFNRIYNAHWPHAQKLTAISTDTNKRCKKFLLVLLQQRQQHQQKYRK